MFKIMANSPADPPRLYFEAEKTAIIHFAPKTYKLKREYFTILIRYNPFVKGKVASQWQLYNTNSYIAVELVYCV